MAGGWGNLAAGFAICDTVIRVSTEFPCHAVVPERCPSGSWHRAEDSSKREPRRFAAVLRGLVRADAILHICASPIRLP